MSSRWTHACCEDCWNAKNPGRTAHKLVDEYREEETCAFCGNPTRSGIYLREDPALVPFPQGGD